MSYTEIFKINPNGDVEFHDEVNNAWRGAMAIWEILNEKYLFNDFEIHTTPQKVWGLQSNLELSKTDMICLHSTFDRILIRREEIPTLVEAFYSFEGVTSLKEQADIIQDLYDSGEDILGICFNQTSVMHGFWDSETRFGVDEDGDECHMNYNINEDSGHKYMFDSDYIKYYM